MTIPHNRRKRTAFTLIELLVVVAIIAVLISILVPSLTAAKKRAKGANCLANTRQLAVAANAYAAEYSRFPTISLANVRIDGYLWNQYWYAGWNTTTQLWDSHTGVLSTYFNGDPRVLTCPETLPSMPQYQYSAGLSGKQLPPVDTYGINSLLDSQLFSSISNPALTAGYIESAVVSSSINAPPNKFMACSYWGYVINPGSAASNSGPSFPAFLMPHNGQGSVSWLDGHASMETGYTKWDSSGLGATYKGNENQLHQYNFGYLTPITNATPFATMRTAPSLDQYFLVTR